MAKKTDNPKHPLVEFNDFYEKLKKQWDENNKQHKELMAKMQKFRDSELKKKKD